MIDEWARRFDLRRCVGCGRCSYVCPVILHYGDFSPRTFSERSLETGEVPRERGIWSCTNCAACSEVCDNGVKFHEFIREVRTSAQQLIPPERTHGGLLELIREINSQDSFSPSREGWVTGGLELDPSSKTMLFVGCIPYFDVIFEELTHQLLEIPRAAVKLLNAMGIRPSLLREERCCGHDSYWLGEEETFLRLARANVRAMKEAGVKRVVTICPEGYSMLKEIYPRFLGPLDFEVVSLLELVDLALSSGQIRLKEGEKILTFHDPCRLARHMGIVEAPRRLLKAMGELSEMGRSGRMAACCGHSHWVNCDSYTRKWQTDRLMEAKDTNADVLVTACPKCLIHLTCAQRGPEWEGKRIPMMDLHVLLSSRIERAL